MVYAEGRTCVVELADLSREVCGGEDVGGGRDVGCCGWRGGGGGGGLFRHFSFFLLLLLLLEKGEKGACREKSRREKTVRCESI